MKTPRLLTTLVAMACAVALSGCGGGAKTGEGLIDGKTPKGTNTCGILGCPTATPKAKATKAPGTGAGARATTPPRKVAPKPTTAPKKTTAPKPVAAPPFRIDLNGDKSGKSLIDPPQAAVFVGTKVVWTNRDTKPHGVQAQNGAFKSGNIAPGASYTWVASAPGEFAYSDSTRPYVNASISVRGR